MRQLTTLALLLAMSCYVSAQTPTDKLLQEAQAAPTLEQNLRVLTDEIGGRIPGTPAMARAEQWGLDAFKAAGGENIHLEPAQLAASWTEGHTQLDVVSQVQFHVRAVSLTWTAPSSSPPLGSPVIDVGSGSAQDFQKAGNLRGAVALVHSHTMKTWDDLFEEYLKQGDLIAAAKKGGAVAVAFISTPDWNCCADRAGRNGHCDRDPVGPCRGTWDGSGAGHNCSRPWLLDATRAAYRGPGSSGSHDCAARRLRGWGRCADN